MTSRKDDPEALHLSVETEQAELYRSLAGLLQQLLTVHFKVPPEDVPTLVHQAFTLYYDRPMECDARTWIVVSACTNAQRYLEMRGLAAGDGAAGTRAVKRFMAHRDTAATLPKAEREAVRLRFEERKSYLQIGEQLGISAFAAKHLVTQAVVTIRRVIRGKPR
jgi:hypothetical protein